MDMGKGMEIRSMVTVGELVQVLTSQLDKDELKRVILYINADIAEFEFTRQLAAEFNGLLEGELNYEQTLDSPHYEEYKPRGKQ